MYTTASALPYYYGNYYILGNLFYELCAMQYMLSTVQQDGLSVLENCVLEIIYYHDGVSVLENCVLEMMHYHDGLSVL